MDRILAILSLFIISLRSFAQSPLKIGDDVPDLMITNIINYKTPQVKLHDFKDKLLIIDFGFTGCSGCIQNLPEMMTLQKKYNHQFQFFWTTYEAVPPVLKLFNKNELLKGLSVPTITSDTQLKKLFPHEVDPHEVWIRNNKVIAITAAEMVNDDNVSKIVQQKMLPNWSSKDEIALNVREKSLLEFSSNTVPLNTLKYYSCVVGALPGTANVQMGFQKDSLSKTIRLFFLRASILDLYSFALPMQDGEAPGKRFILEVKDKSILDYKYHTGTAGLDATTAYRSEWFRKYAHSYEATAPLSTTKEQMQEKMRQDLNYYFNLNGRRNKRTVKTWGITLLNGDSSQVLHNPINDGHSKEKRYAGIAVTSIANEFNLGANYETAIYVDESGFTGRTNLDVSNLDVNDYKAVKSLLNKYGLNLVPGERTFSFIVISEPDYKAPK
ncbi:hypothetical protein SAMN05216436_104198 [bacterium A37T11]|nr:hypothetical protein SAMN05216436_104198 [bacterium A37T11]